MNEENNNTEKPKSDIEDRWEQLLEDYPCKDGKVYNMKNADKPIDKEHIIEGAELEELIGEMEVLHEKLRALGLAIEDLNPKLAPIMRKGVPEEEHGNYDPFSNVRRSPRSRIAKKIHYLIQVSIWSKNYIDYILKYADIK